MPRVYIFCNMELFKTCDVLPYEIVSNIIVKPGVSLNNALLDVSMEP